MKSKFSEVQITHMLYCLRQIQSLIILFLINGGFFFFTLCMVLASG